MKTRDKLIHALTAYDRKQSVKPDYNRHALGIYFQMLDNVMADIERGADARAAIVAGFQGRLCNALLKELDLPLWTKEDATNSSVVYHPVTPA